MDKFLRLYIYLHKITRPNQMFFLLLKKTFLLPHIFPYIQPYFVYLGSNAGVYKVWMNSMRLQWKANQQGAVRPESLSVKSFAPESQPTTRGARTFTDTNMASWVGVNYYIYLLYII